MKKGDEVFVYGTLRKGERADLSKSASAFSVEYLGDDAINGKLYHLGAYPGIKLLASMDKADFSESAPIVYGEAYYINHSSVGALLDAYEGYNSASPSEGLYDREQVVTRNGRIVWVYVFNGMVTEDQLIETGDWKNPRIMCSRSIPVLTIGKRTN